MSLIRKSNNIFLTKIKNLNPQIFTKKPKSRNIDNSIFLLASYLLLFFFDACKAPRIPPIRAPPPKSLCSLLVSYIESIIPKAIGIAVITDNGIKIGAVKERASAFAKISKTQQYSSPVNQLTISLIGHITSGIVMTYPKIAIKVIVFAGSCLFTFAVGLFCGFVSRQDKTEYIYVPEYIQTA